MDNLATYYSQKRKTSFQVVEWRFLGKHCFFRWYRVSDYPGQVSIFQVVAWVFSGSIYVLVILGRFRVYRNQYHLMCNFQVVEWRALSKHRFFRWYRVSDYPRQFLIFQVVEWGVFRKQLCSSNLRRFGLFLNQYNLICYFQVVKWRVLRKHRFCRWYRVSDYRGKLSVFQVVAWGFLGKHLCSGNWGRLRVYHNQHLLSAFKVVEWSVLRKHRFFRCCGVYNKHHSILDEMNNCLSNLRLVWYSKSKVLKLPVL